MKDMVKVERTIDTRTQRTVSIVAGPVARSKGDRVMIEHALDEWKHHAKVNQHLSWATIPVSDFDTFPDGSVGFEIDPEDPRSRITYRFRLVPA